MVENHVIYFVVDVLKVDERTVCVSVCLCLFPRRINRNTPVLKKNIRCYSVLFLEINVFFFACSLTNSSHIHCKNQPSVEINIHCWRGVWYLQCDQLIKPGAGRGPTRLTSSGLDLDSPFFLSSPCSL